MVVSLFDFYRYGFKSKDVNVANQTLLFFTVKFYHTLPF